MNDHILIEQIPVDVEVSIFDAIAAMTMQVGRQEHKECYKLLLPTIDKQQ